MSSEFAKNLQTWKEQLNGKDKHAIWRRVATLLTYDAVWRTYNEARGVSRITNDPSTGLAGTIIEVFDEGFFCLQVFEISKLVEKNWDQPEKQIYSLRRLFDEIKNCQELYTREKYITYDGISYEKGINENWKIEFKREYRHGKYDIISSVPEKDRSKSDKLSDAYLGRIEKEFETFKDLATYRSKFLAHAADPGNRPDDILDKITLAYFDQCYQSIIKIGKMVELLLDELLLCEPPVLMYDVFENWDKPAVTSNDIRKLEEYWDRRLDQIRGWNETATLIKS
ncbi:MAG: hypothetical protein ACYS0I_07660 [Planctomycetota bacterium]|jgi:hypothetical protein